MGVHSWNSFNIYWNFIWLLYFIKMENKTITFYPAGYFLPDTMTDDEKAEFIRKRNEEIEKWLAKHGIYKHKPTFKKTIII